MREIKAIIRPDRLYDVVRALHDIPDLPGVTISNVRGVGKQHPADDASPTFEEISMAKLEIVVPLAVVDNVVQAIERAGHTGRVGDGKIFVLPVEHAIKIRSGDEDARAL